MGYLATLFRNSFRYPNRYTFRRSHSTVSTPFTANPLIRNVLWVDFGCYPHVLCALLIINTYMYACIWMDIVLCLVAVGLLIHNPAAGGNAGWVLLLMMMTAGLLRIS